MKIHSGRVVCGLSAFMFAVAFFGIQSAPAQQSQRRTAPPGGVGPGMQPPNTAKPGGKTTKPRRASAKKNETEIAA